MDQQHGAENLPKSEVQKPRMWRPPLSPTPRSCHPTCSLRSHGGSLLGDLRNPRHLWHLKKFTKGNGFKCALCRKTGEEDSDFVTFSIIAIIGFPLQLFFGWKDFMKFSQMALLKPLFLFLLCMRLKPEQAKSEVPR